MTTETQPQPPAYPAQPQPEKKGMAIAAMVLGIIAVVLAFIPILGMVAFLLGGLAVILGIVAFIKRRGRGQAITGIITGVVAFIIAGIVTALTGAFLGAVDEGLQGAQEDLEQLEADVEEAAAESDEDVEADIEEVEEAVEEEEEEPAEEPAGEWVEVASLSGTGDQRGEVFTIENDARIIYEFNAADEDFALGTIYLMAEGDNLTDDGGLPEAMLSGSESGETMLYQTGNYYLDVSAANYESWTVTIEEQQ